MADQFEQLRLAIQQHPLQQKGLIQLLQYQFSDACSPGHDLIYRILECLQADMVLENHIRMIKRHVLYEECCMDLQKTLERWII